MFKNVIVGVDGGDGGRDAIALARTLCDADGTLTLTHVYRVEAEPWRGWNPDYDAAQRERARELLEAERELAEREAQVRVTGDASVGRGLHLAAELTGADLLVVGSSRRGILGRVLLRDDTHAALNGAGCAVAVAPAGYGLRPGMMREIGVGYDGSPESERALRVARDLAADSASRLSAFEAVSLPAFVYPEAVAADPDAVEEMVSAARERVSALDGVEPHAAYGEPAEELALYGASLDLLVIGSRSYGPRRRLVHGSTAQQLARTARCPLLVVPRGAGIAADGEATAAGHEKSAAGAAA